MLIAMKQISDRDGDPDVFYLSSGGDGLELDGAYARPAFTWGAGNAFVFLSRKFEFQKLCILYFFCIFETLLL